MTTKKRLYDFLNGKKIVSEKYSGHLVIKQYYEGRIAIQAVCDDGTPLAVLTVNIPDEKIKRNEIIVKAWSENERIAQDMLKTGWFKDTGRRIPTGFVEAQVWEVTP